MSKLVYGLDVGTTKIVAIAGRVDGRRPVEILAMGEAPSYGLRRGVVVDRESATESIAEAVEACGGGSLRGGPVSVGIAGSHIRSLNTEVTLLNRSRNRLVTERFVRRLHAEARGTSAGEEEEVLHVVPRSFVLDGTEGVRQPVGLAARRVTMRGHVVTGAISSIQNLLGAVEDCGVRVARVVLEPLASSEACLTPDDRQMGVALLDVGGGTTDIAAFVRGALTHTAVVPIGGRASRPTSPTG
ncbi:cell division protein FtsA [Rubrobacter marinus]|nr:cell division protein FtsA [Rubrobacter marinus]